MAMVPDAELVPLGTERSENEVTSDPIKRRVTTFIVYLTIGRIDNNLISMQLIAFSNLAQNFVRERPNPLVSNSTNKLTPVSSAHLGE